MRVISHRGQCVTRADLVRCQGSGSRSAVRCYTIAAQQHASNSRPQAGAANTFILNQGSVVRGLLWKWRWPRRKWRMTQTAYTLFKKNRVNNSLHLYRVKKFHPLRSEFHSILTPHSKNCGVKFTPPVLIEDHTMHFTPVLNLRCKFNTQCCYSNTFGCYFNTLWCYVQTLYRV